GNQRRGDHVYNTIVELAGKVGDVGGHRGSADLRDHDGLRLVVIKYGHFLARSLGQRVDLTIVDKDVGAAGGCNTHDTVGAVVQLVGIGRRRRQHLQQHAQVVHARHATDRVEGAGIAVEQSRTDTGNQCCVALAGLQVLGGDTFIGK